MYQLHAYKKLGFDISRKLSLKEALTFHASCLLKESKLWHFKQIVSLQFAWNVK